MNKNKKRLIFLGLGLAILALIAGIYLKGRRSQTVYTTTKADKGDLSQTVSLTGTLTSDHKTSLSFRTPGILKSVNFEVGDFVKKTQVLATIDTGTLLSQKKEAQAQLKYQKEVLENMRGHKSLYNGDQRDAQKAQVEASEAAVQKIDDQLKDLYLISPMDGVVIKKNANLGETVVLDLNSPVLTIAQKDDLIIEANVPESDITKIKLGQEASVTFDALSSEDVFPATIYEIDPASTLVQDVVYYRIKIKLSKVDERLKEGMSVNIDVKTAEKKGVVMAPARGIKSDGKVKYVEILEAENQVRRQDIQLGLVGDDGLTEVISGLQGGEEIITFIKNN